MKPINFQSHSKKGWQIIHACQKCGTQKLNRIAPDDIDSLLEMAKKISHTQI